MSSSSVLLAIDTSSDACSVALGVGEAVHERHEIAPREHARLVLPMVQALLAEAGLSLTEVDALVMGRGPGAFTGLRIAAGVIQGLAFSVDRPVVPVSSLAIVAQGEIAAGAAQVAVAFDARMGEVYWGTFGRDETGLAVARDDEAVIAPTAVELAAIGDWVGAGSGFAAYPQELGQRLALMACHADHLPRAGHALALGERAWRAGEAVDAAQAQPIYLRDRVVRR